MHPTPWRDGPHGSVRRVRRPSRCALPLVARQHAVLMPFAGATAAAFAKERLLAALVQDERYREKDYTSALRAAFLKTDAELRGEPATRAMPLPDAV